MSLGSVSQSSFWTTGRAVALFILLTAAFTYPLSLNPASTVVADVPDTHLFIWTLAWNTHALTEHPLALFDANIYHPQRLTLAYSENLIGSALVATPVQWLTGNPVLAMNMVALSSCALCGIGAYLLGRRAGLGAYGALLCGIVFAFSPPRFFRISQIHLATVQWIPFALASLHAYFDEGRSRHLKWVAAFATLQVLCTGHGAVFLGFSAGLFIVWRFALGDPLKPMQRVRDLGWTGAALLAPAILVFVPYRMVQLEMGLRRTLENWAVPAESFIASPSWLHALVLSRVAPHTNETASAYLFPGYLPILFALAAIWWRRETILPPLVRLVRRLSPIVTIAACLSLVLAIAVTMSGPVRVRVGSLMLFSARTPLRAWMLFAALAAVRVWLHRSVPFAPISTALEIRRALMRNKYPQSITAFYLLLTVACLLLAAGPPISLWPLVYWLPGFNFIRGPSRFTIPAILGLAVLAGVGFERLVMSLSSRRRALAATITGAAMLAEFAPLPLGVVPYRLTIPPADQWLALQPKPFVVAEVPVGGERHETNYMLHSMAHWQKTVHGYSGIRPALHENLYVQMRNFPDEASIQSLQQLGVTYVVVHTDLYPPGQWAAIEDRFKAFEPRLRLTHAARGGLVYLLSPPSR